VNQTFYIAGTAMSNLPVFLQFPELVNYLNNQGFVTKKTLPAENFIGMNHSEREYSKFLNAGGAPSRAVLVLLEPEAVFPSQYKKRVLRKYGLVLRPGNPSHHNTLGKFIAWSYESNPNPLTPTAQKLQLKDYIAKNVTKGLFKIENWKARDQYIVIINSNKVSPATFENYSLRRIFAHEIDPALLSVYGDLWDTKIWKKIRHRLEVILFSVRNVHLPNFKNIYGNLHWSFPASRGIIADKQVALQNFRFNIVIENDRSYISEKLFDSMINGSIPIYSGPDIPDEIIPREAYIKLPESPTELLNTLQALSDAEVKRVLTQIQDFISSDTFLSVWEKEVVFARMGQEISFYLGAIHE